MGKWFQSQRMRMNLVALAADLVFAGVWVLAKWPVGDYVIFTGGLHAMITATSGWKTITDNTGLKQTVTVGSQDNG